MDGQATNRLLLVGWDAADWAVIRPLMRAGRMPHLERLVEGGVSGELSNGEPFDSTVAWTTLVTGVRAARHGVWGGYEVDESAAGLVRAAASFSRRRKAIWNLAGVGGRRVVQVGFPATHPAEVVEGVSVSREFVRSSTEEGGEGGVYPEGLREGLERLRVRLPDLGALGGGLNVYLPFVPGAAGIDLSRDIRLLSVGMSVAESATLQAMATMCVGELGGEWGFAAAHYPGIAQLSRAFMSFAGPKRANVSERDFELYRGVVDAMYEFHDAMLGRLIELSGPGARVMVVSAHGFASGGGRPEQSARGADDLGEWQRRDGIFVMAGPGVRSDEMIEGATSLDVVPTLLRLMGMAVARDLEGRVLAEALEEGWAVAERVESYEIGDSVASRVSREGAKGAAEEEAAIGHLLELGYARPSPERFQRGAAAVEEGNRYNLARSLLDAGEAGEAAKVLEGLVRLRPERMEYAKALFDAYAALGRTEEMERLVVGLWDRGYRGPLVQLGRGVVALARRRPAEALKYFEGVDGGAWPALGVYVGRAMLRLRNWEGAREAFGRVVGADDRNEFGWAGLAQAQLGLGEVELAAESAMKAVGIKSNLAEAHYHLGIAMRRLGHADRAAVALSRCIAVAPGFLPAYRRLAEVYGGALGDVGKAGEITRRANHLMLVERARRREVGDRGGVGGGRTGGSW